MTASNNLANSVGSTALATVSLTAQSAAQAATTLYTPASDGLFTINYYAKVTTAATTSSTLGVFSVISTDTDSNVVTSVGQSTQQNSLTTGFISGSITVYAKASTPIQYSLAYASSGATAMQYELRVVVAGTTAPSSTGTVSSFNGRTGAVTPGSSDYTAAQVGAVPSTSLVAAKNGVINGGMDIWQRGTSFAINASVLYTADRWQAQTGGTALTVSQVSANVKTTSTSSVAIATGSLTFTIPTGLVIAAGQGFNATDTASIYHAVTGTVTSYNSSTGSLVANITSVLGSGTYASWNITVGTLPQFNYALRAQRNNGATFTNSIYVAQSVETVNSIPFSGQTVTLSFWARTGTNFSGSSISAFVNCGFGVDGNVLNGLSGSVSVISTSFGPPTTSWTQYSFTGTVALGATQIGLYFSYNPTGTAGAADYFDITGVQLEIGSTATAFSRAGGTIQGELAACQRYCYVPAGGYAAFGTTYSSTSASVGGITPVTMRAAPTFTVGSLTSAFYINGVVAYTPTSVSSFTSSVNGFNFLATGWTGATIGWFGQWTNSFTLSAEL